MLTFRTLRTRFLTVLHVCSINSRQNTTVTAVYRVNGASLTFDAVSKVAPEQRTVAHWQVLLDWERQRTQPYVIVDPFDPSGLLYFSEVEYKIQARTLGSMNTPFIVVARPGSVRPIPSSQNSPPLGESSFEELDPITWRAMKNLRSFIARNVTWTKAGVVRVNDRNVMGLVWLWSRELFHQLGENGWAKRQGQLVAFVVHLQNILRRNGSTFAIQRLKITLFALYSWVGGNPLKSTHELGQRIRLRNGLPTWLPRNALRRSKATGLRAIRLWASLLNIYKYIHGKHPSPPLETIMAPGFTGSYSDFRDFCYDFRELLSDEIGFVPDFKYKSAKGLIIRTAGANHGVSMLSAPADSFAWDQVPINWPREWFKFWNDKDMLELMDDVKSRFSPKCRAKGECNSCSCIPRLGRLHPIQEAAGKVRVVAICDYFTQVALKPVHDYLFRILRRIPTDATFDQQGRVDEFASRGYKEIFSFDLKAATDLIPIELYFLIMREFLGFRAVPIWEAMLTKRDFYAKPKDFDLPEREEMAPAGNIVRYTRGQPMGALSSWASLALLHHGLVQFAAQRVQVTGMNSCWFSDYLVLGDDIVIANEKVAQSYLEVCSKFGITVGLAKSLISREGLMNFASQTVLRNENISPLSLKEALSAQNIPMRVALVDRVFHRWGGDKTGFGYIKRILSEPQWSAVSDGGIRGSGRRNLDLIRFLVENPFIKEDVTTGNVISWLGFLDPELRKLPNEFHLDFDRLLRVILLRDLFVRFRSKRLEVDSVRAHIRLQLESGAREEVLLTGKLRRPVMAPGVDADLFEFIGHLWGDPDGGPGFDPRYEYSYDEPNAKYPSMPDYTVDRLYGVSHIYKEYLLESLLKHLELTVAARLENLKARITIPFEVLDDQWWNRKPPEEMTLACLCQAWLELMDIPKVSVKDGTDLERTLFALFRDLPDDEATASPFVRKKEVVPSWRRVREEFSGPLVAVSKVLVQLLGYYLPVELLLHRDSRHISSMLRRIAAETHARRIQRDASPCIVAPLPGPVDEGLVNQPFPVLDSDTPQTLEYWMDMDQTLAGKIVTILAHSLQKQGV